MKNLETSGIYAIINTDNGKMYIGSSVNMSKREWEHFRKLRKNRHHSRYLQHAYNKYGEDAFEFTLVEFCSIETLLDREQYYLDTYTPEYNMKPNATNMRGFVISDESKEKHRRSMAIYYASADGKARREEHSKRMSGKNNPGYGIPLSKERRAHLSKINSGGNHPKSKSIKSLNPETDEVVMVYGSMREAERLTGLPRMTIKAYCDKPKILGGFRWEYTDEDRSAV